MKKMMYEKPSMKVVVLSEQSQLLAGSAASAGFGGSYNYCSDSWEHSGGYSLGDGGDL